jgi:hypothetical protein
LTKQVNFVIGAIFAILLISVDFSLQSSLAFDRSHAVWTAWYYTIHRIRVADLLIAGLAVATAVGIVRRWASRPLKSYYLALPALALVYLGIGGLYNIFVYYAPKDWLYDAGVILFLSVPYLALHYLASPSLQGWFTPVRIFALAAMGTVLDFVIVTLKGTVEYPHFLRLPAILTLVPLGVSAAAVIYSPGLRYRLGFLALWAIDLLSAVNRLALSQLATLVGDVGFSVLLPQARGRILRFGIVLVGIVVFNVGSVVMLTNPFDWGLISAKAEGIATRRIQIEDMVMNYDHNLPVLIGKGLGATWFDYVPVPPADIYSVGTSVGDTPQQSIASPVQFIFNFGPPALIYKWGLIGIVLLAWLLARFYGGNRDALDSADAGHNGVDRKWLRLALLIAFLFALHNFTYVGALRDSFITSLLAYYIERRALARPLAQNPGGIPAIAISPAEVGR